MSVELEFCKAVTRQLQIPDFTPSAQKLSYSKHFMLTDKKRLAKLFSFLEENHHRSVLFQKSEWAGLFGGCSSSSDRLTALLYGIVNTQPKPKLDLLEEFWINLHRNYCHSDDRTLRGFCRFLGTDTGKPLTDLYHGLAAKKGWGHKTAALFVKNIINIHRLGPKSIHIFSDGRQITKNIHPDELIHLPVDAVIAFVFGLQDQGVSVRYRHINKHIQMYSARMPEQMLIWDDLWFWGFITQKGEGAKRIMKWNAPKFWALRSHSKLDVVEIETLANKFIKIVRPS